MFITLYTHITASPWWWIFLLGGQVFAFISTLSYRPTWRVRGWQGAIVLLAFICVFHLVHRMYPPLDRYMGAVFFAGIAAAIFLSANSITNAITERKFNHVTLAILLGWLFSLPMVLASAAFCLFIGLSILIFH